MRLGIQESIRMWRERRETAAKQAAAQAAIAKRIPYQHADSTICVAFRVPKNKRWHAFVKQETAAHKARMADLKAWGATFPSAEESETIWWYNWAAMREAKGFAEYV